MFDKPNIEKSMKKKGLSILIIGFFIFYTYISWAETTRASWYSVESCRKEGTSGICADGSRFVDTDLTCASWYYSFGTVLKVVNQLNGKVVVVRVTDRGPSKRLVRSGRALDLSRGAFECIADLKQGVVPVEITMVKGARLCSK